MTKENDTINLVFASVQAADNTNAAADYTCEGLTKLEYFTVMAMQGMLPNDVDTRYDEKTLAKFAVSQAKALIAELNTETLKEFDKSKTLLIEKDKIEILLKEYKSHIRVKERAVKTRADYLQSFYNTRISVFEYVFETLGIPYKQAVK